MPHRPRSFAESLQPDDWAALRGRALRALHPPGTRLLTEGAHASGAVLVLGGRVELFRERAGRRVPLEVVDAGGLLPDLGALHGRPATVSAVSLDRVDALLVPALAFAAFLEGRPAAALAALRSQSDALSHAYARTSDNAVGDTASRLAVRLLELADRYGRRHDRAIAIDLPLTQDELAGWIGASHKATATALGHLRRLGCVQTGRRRVVITDADALRRITAAAGAPGR